MSRNSNKVEQFLAKVLVIEDDPTILTNTVELLELEGFDVVGAPDGAAGIQQAQAFLPDMIICDVLMPKVDGYGVLSTLRANPATADIPLVFVSAIPREDMPPAAASLPIADYLVKPFRANELLQVVRSVLGQRQ
jgi:CheY-like chemotaxis protein